MWQYQKRLQYPVNIKATDPRLAQLIIAQYGGPNGNCLSKFLTSKKHI
jgi:spore coat protein JC